MPNAIPISLALSWLWATIVIGCVIYGGILMEVLNVVAIIVAGLMVGCELAIAAFVHPTLDKLPDDVHLSAASALARVLGTVMPFWYNLTFLLTCTRPAFRMRGLLV